MMTNSVYLWARENTAPLLRICFREMIMQTLDPIAKDRYTEKLHMVGLLEDLYKLWNDKDMVDNMLLWPGVYTKQQLVQWKTWMHTTILKVAM